jgi:[1-hydroxy-2-(trimethylamino)ethyl]phosphonate dioxygenase
MSNAEIAEFRANPFHDAAVKVRLWDEGGKVPGMKTRNFRDYVPLLDSVVRRHAID